MNVEHGTTDARRAPPGSTFGARPSPLPAGGGAASASAFAAGGRAARRTVAFHLDDDDDGDVRNRPPARPRGEGGDNDAPYPPRGPRAPRTLSCAPLLDADLPPTPAAIRSAVRKFFTLDGMESMLNCVPLTVDPRSPNSRKGGRGDRGAGEARREGGDVDDDGAARARCGSNHPCFFTGREVAEFSFMAEREAVVGGRYCAPSVPDEEGRGGGGNEETLLGLVKQTAWNLGRDLTPRSLSGLTPRGLARSAAGFFGGGDGDGDGDDVVNAGGGGAGVGAAVTPRASNHRQRRVPEAVVVVGDPPGGTANADASMPSSLIRGGAGAEPFPGGGVDCCDVLAGGALGEEDGDPPLPVEEGRRDERPSAADIVLGGLWSLGPSHGGTTSTADEGPSSSRSAEEAEEGRAGRGPTVVAEGGGDDDGGNEPSWLGEGDVGPDDGAIDEGEDILAAAQRAVGRAVSPIHLLDQGYWPQDRGRDGGEADATGGAVEATRAIQEVGDSYQESSSLSESGMPTAQEGAGEDDAGTEDEGTIEFNVDDFIVGGFDADQHEMDENGLGSPRGQAGPAAGTPKADSSVTAEGAPAFDDALRGRGDAHVMSEEEAGRRFDAVASAFELSLDRNSRRGSRGGAYASARRGETQRELRDRRRRGAGHRGKPSPLAEVAAHRISSNKRGDGDREGGKEDGAGRRRSSPPSSPRDTFLEGTVGRRLNRRSAAAPPPSPGRDDDDGGSVVSHGSVLRRAGRTVSRAAGAAKAISSKEWTADGERRDDQPGLGPAADLIDYRLEGRGFEGGGVVAAATADYRRGGAEGLDAEANNKAHGQGQRPEQSQEQGQDQSHEERHEQSQEHNGSDEVGAVPGRQREEAFSHLMSSPSFASAGRRRGLKHLSRIRSPKVTPRGESADYPDDEGSVGMRSKDPQRSLQEGRSPVEEMKASQQGGVTRTDPEPLPGANAQGDEESSFNSSSSVNWDVLAYSVSDNESQQQECAVTPAAATAAAIIPSANNAEVADESALHPVDSMPARPADRKSRIRALFESPSAESAEPNHRVHESPLGSHTPSSVVRSTRPQGTHEPSLSPSPVSATVRRRAGAHVPPSPEQRTGTSSNAALPNRPAPDSTSLLSPRAWERIERIKRRHDADMGRIRNVASDIERASEKGPQSPSASVEEQARGLEMKSPKQHGSMIETQSDEENKPISPNTISSGANKMCETKQKASIEEERNDHDVQQSEGEHRLQSDLSRYYDTIPRARSTAEEEVQGRIQDMREQHQKNMARMRHALEDTTKFECGDNGKYSSETTAKRSSALYTSNSDFSSGHPLPPFEEAKVRAYDYVGHHGRGAASTSSPAAMNYTTHKHHFNFDDGVRGSAAPLSPRAQSIQELMAQNEELEEEMRQIRLLSPTRSNEPTSPVPSALFLPLQRMPGDLGLSTSQLPSRRKTYGGGRGKLPNDSSSRRANLRAMMSEVDAEEEQVNSRISGLIADVKSFLEENDRMQDSLDRDILALRD